MPHMIIQPVYGTRIVETYDYAGVYLVDIRLAHRQN